MRKVQIRPRYNLYIDLPPEEVLNRFRAVFKRKNSLISGKVINPHVIIQINDSRQHYWSPQLTIEVEASNEKQCSLLRCIIGPMPAVWTMFASFYALSIFIGIVGLVWGGSQWSLNMEPYALWLVPVSLIMITASYMIALTGQRLGYDQMLMLQQFLQNTLQSRITEL